MAQEWLKRCESSFCFSKPGTDPEDIQAEINRRLEKTREEMKDWTKQKVDEIFKKYGKPAGNPYEVIKIPKNDKEALPTLDNDLFAVKLNETRHWTT